MSRKKKVTEDYLVTVQFVCPNCGKVHYLKNISHEKLEQFLCRRTLGKTVQEIFPELSARDRKKFLTNYCDKCQKEIFGDDEDEDS